MILDKEAMFCDKIPFDQTSDHVDIVIDDVTSFGPNFGEPVQILVKGFGLTESSGEPIVEIQETGEPAVSWTWAMRVLIGPAALGAKGVIITLPSNISRFVRLKLVGFDCGDWTAAVVLKHL